MTPSIVYVHVHVCMYYECVFIYIVYVRTVLYADVDIFICMYSVNVSMSTCTYTVCTVHTLCTIHTLYVLYMYTCT